jgi:type I restriction enzyme, S subunit
LYGQIRVGKRLIQEASTGGMKGMVSKSRFEGVTLIVPPLTLQREFTQRVLAVENVKGMHRASLSQMETLFASLQHHAFRGEL